MFKKWLCELVLAGTILNSGCALPKKTDFEDYKNSSLRELVRLEFLAPQQPKYVDRYTREQAEKLKGDPVDGIILVAEPDEWYEHLRGPVEFIYEWRIASVLKDLGVKRYTISFSATTEDLKHALYDPDIQTIVVAGHGQWNHWSASDTIITESTLDGFMQRCKVVKKKGLFINHHCGNYRYSDDDKPIVTYEEKQDVESTLIVFGATDLYIDDHWRKQDKYYGVERNRFFYGTTSKADVKRINEITKYWNAEMTRRGKLKEKPCFGTSAVDNPSQARSHMGETNPFDYLFNPIPPANHKTYK